MKILTIVLAGLMAVSANAGLLDYQKPGYMIQSATNKNVTGIPNAYVGQNVGFGGHWISITNLCVEGNMIKAIKPFSVCTGYTDERDVNGDLTGEKVCSSATSTRGGSPISGMGRQCDDSLKAKIAWKRANGNKKFRNDFPNCSVFKTYNTTRQTTWKFNIVKKVSKRSSKYQSRYNGQFVKSLTYTLPACYGYATSK